MNFNIKEYSPGEKPEDLNALLTAFLEIWNSDENLKYLSYTLKPFDKQIIKKRIERHKAHGIRYICAENEDNEILGIATIRVDGIEGFEIYGIGVKIESKKQGIGRRLIEYTINLAKELEYKAIDAFVFADNSVMLRLLLLLGFLPIGMEYHKRADGADLVQMKLFL